MFWQRLAARQDVGRLTGDGWMTTEAAADLAEDGVSVDPQMARRRWAALSGYLGELAMSVAELARRSGVKSAIPKWKERGITVANENTQRVCDALEIDEFVLMREARVERRAKELAAAH